MNKYRLVLILENNDQTVDLLSDLAHKGFNATVLIAKSLKHILDEDEHDDDRLFISLRHLKGTNTNDSTFAYFILDKEELDKVQELVREETNHFTKIKGGMYYSEITNFEGSI